MLFHNM